MKTAPDLARTRTKYLDDGEQEVARLFDGASPGEFGPLPRFGPSAQRLRTIVGNCLDGPFVENPESAGRAFSTGMGESPQDFFAGVASHIKTERGRALLAEYWARFVDAAYVAVEAQGGGKLEPKAVAQIAVDVLIADYVDESGGEFGYLVPDDPDAPTPQVSIYALFMRRRYPLSAQTPGGPNWPTDPDAKRDSQADWAAPWKKIPGIW